MIEECKNDDALTEVTFYRGGILETEINGTFDVIV